MFATIEKIWTDTTTMDGRYVAKDVKGMLAFMVGVSVLCGAATAAGFGVSITTVPGEVLLAYSLGNQAFKSYYQYKNNAVAQDCGPGDEIPPASPGPQTLMEAS